MAVSITVSNASNMTELLMWLTKKIDCAPPRCTVEMSTVVEDKTGGENEAEAYHATTSNSSMSNSSMSNYSMGDSSMIATNVTSNSSTTDSSGSVVPTSTFSLVVTTRTPSLVDPLSDSLYDALSPNHLYGELGMATLSVSDLRTVTSMVSPSPPQPPAIPPPAIPPATPLPSTPDGDSFVTIDGGPAALTEDASAGGMVTVLAGVLAALACCCCIVYCRRRVLRQRAGKPHSKASLDAESRWVSKAGQGKAVGEAGKDGALLEWSQVELLSRFDEGSIGKLYFVRLVSEHKIEDEAETPQLLVRRLNLDAMSRLQTEQLLVDEGMLMGLEHPHLLPHIALITDGADRWGFIMPYEKRSLSLLLSRAVTHEGTAASLKEVTLHMMADVAAAVAHLHANQLTCLCLRPSNILLDRRMQVKLTDYGRQPALAAMLLGREVRGLETGRDSSGGVTIMRPTALDARYLYYPPEILAQQAQALGRGGSSLSDGASDTASLWGSAVDLWSLGCVIVRTMTLRPLYDDMGGASALSPLGLAKHLEDDSAGPAQGIDDIPTGLVDLVERCTSAKPSQRLAAEQVIQELYKLHANRASVVAARRTKRMSMRRSTRTSTRTTELPAAHRLPSPAESRLTISRGLTPFPPVDQANYGSDELRAGVPTSIHESPWMPPSYPKPEVPEEESSESPLASPHDDETSAALSRPSVAAFYAEEGQKPLPEALQRPSVAAFYDDGTGIQGRDDGQKPLPEALQRPSVAAYYDDGAGPTEGSGSGLMPDALSRPSVAAFYGCGADEGTASSEAPKGDERRESTQPNAGIARPARLPARGGASLQVPPARLPAPNTYSDNGGDENAGVARPVRLPRRDRAVPHASAPGPSAAASDAGDGNAGVARPARLPRRDCTGPLASAPGPSTAASDAGDGNAGVSRPTRLPPRGHEAKAAYEAQGESVAMSSLVQMVEDHEAAASADQATHKLEGRLASRARRQNKSRKSSGDAQTSGEMLAETEAPERVRI